MQSVDHERINICIYYSFCLSFLAFKAKIRFSNEPLQVTKIDQEPININAMPFTRHICNNSARQRFRDTVPHSFQSTPIQLFCLRKLVDRFWTCDPYADYKWYVLWCKHNNVTLVERPKNWGGKLSLLNYEEHMIHLYTRNEYFRNLNRELLSGEIYPLNEIFAFILVTCPMKKGGMNEIRPKIVYRAMKLNNQQLSDYQPGREIVWCSIVSTSIDREVADFFMGNTLFIIHLKGKWERYAMYIGCVSQFPEEKEVLISMQTTFLVRTITENNGVTQIEMDTVRNYIDDAL